jgi:antitoxin (DNA-binding transcriptional repressor) of toxin-antitoxin stability system
MEKIVTATEAVRDFSTILNRVKFSGDNYIIKRNGKFVALISSIGEKVPVRPLKELKNILKQLPRLDDELDSFSDDLNTIVSEQPGLPDRLNWV